MFPITVTLRRLPPHDLFKTIVCSLCIQFVKQLITLISELKKAIFWPNPTYKLRPELTLAYS